MKSELFRALKKYVFPAVILLALTALYFLAGAQERAAELAAPQPSATAAATPSPSPAPSPTPPGLERLPFLAALNDAGYSCAADIRAYRYALIPENGTAVAEIELALSDGRVRGATLLFEPLEEPALPAAEERTAIESALYERYSTAKSARPAAVSAVLDAVFSALDTENRLPATVRAQWFQLLLQSLETGKRASDSYDGVRFTIYEGLDATPHPLCCAIQFPLP